MDGTFNQCGPAAAATVTPLFVLQLLSRRLLAENEDFLLLFNIQLILQKNIDVLL